MTRTIKVATEVGTFKRRTARAYECVVVGMGVRHELLEGARLAGIAYAQEQLVRYSDPVTHKATFIRTDKWNDVGRAFDLKCYEENLKDGSFVRWAADCRARIARLEAEGPFTQDQGTDYEVIGWSSRFDLALKMAGTRDALRYRNVRVYDVATGQRLAGGGR